MNSYPPLQEDKAKAKEETFLETKEAKTLLEKYLAMQWVWGLFLKWTYFSALKLALKSKLDKYEGSQTY